MYKLIGLILLILIPILCTDVINGGREDFLTYIYLAGIFIPALLFYYYYFYIFPRALRKSDALIRAVKLIYSAVEECVIDRELRQRVIKRLDEKVLVLGKMMDQKIKILRNPILLKSRLRRAKPFEQEWKQFFLQAFSVIERELEDETIRTWTFNKIRNKLNGDSSSQHIKVVLREIIGDSKYTHIVK